MYFFCLIIAISCNNGLDSKKKFEVIYHIDSFNKTKKSVGLSQQFPLSYDSLRIINTIGSSNFFKVRSNYKSKLQDIINKLTSVLDEYQNFDKDSFSNNIDYILIKSKLSFDNLLYIIPTSPTEFKIYDSCFSIKRSLQQISFYEKLIFSIASFKTTRHSLQNTFIESYSNMFLYQYTYLDPSRLEDGYYFYDLNSIICNNRTLFCDSIWKNLSPLKNIQPELQNLYNCRCVNRDSIELNFCDLK